MRRTASAASFAQQRLWFLDQFEPGTAAYNLPYVFRIAGKLNVDTLTRALHAVIQRHESLRTVFDSVDGEAQQVVLPDADVPLSILDVTGLPEGERESEALRIASVEAEKPFDLSAGPLLRATLVRIDPAKYMLVLVMHHIITDGWSVSRFLRDLTTYYAAFTENTEPRLPDLPIQYAEYARWQREYISGEVLKKEVEHWKKALDGAQTVLELPTDHLPSSTHSWQKLHGAYEDIKMDSITLGKLKSLAQSEKSTLFIVSIAAFQALLWRYTHQESILVGTPIGARNDIELENMIGLFVNTLVFRADFASNLSFRELVRQVRSFALEAYAHQDMPFEKLVEELVPQRSLNTPPLFQVMFIFQNIPKQLLEISGLKIEEISFETGTAKFDLSLEVWERDDQFQCRFEYNADLFEQATIARMLGHLERLIHAALQQPDRPLAELPLLSPGEREKVLVEWNQTATTFFPEASIPCIHELFESQVERSPEAVALIAGNVELSYGEVNRRANQLARYLQKQGVGPEVPVGVWVDRGPEMVIALLGILKAGGAYVPLDSRLPDDRLSFMLSDVKPRIVVTEKNLRRDVFGPDTLLLDSDGPLIAQESAANTQAKLSPQTLAYVMYTSGSTGRPKGVLVEHGGVVNLLCSMQREPGLRRDDVLLAVTTISFDMAGPEIYLPLISGARIVIADSKDVVDGNRLRDLLSNSRATCLQATPSTWRLLIEAGWQGSPDLKILCGGEALPPELARELTRRSNSVWNVYGPTETTIWSTTYRVTGREKGSIPIGRPIANTAIYILDSNRKPVPVNVTGEIYIGGDGLTRGYLNRPELTAERFVDVSQGPNLSSRLYRTGDLGRFRLNGEIEYLGRVDSQVKLRGQRIELEEIDTVLASHPALREAVVIMMGAGEQQKLCAYLVLNHETVEPSAGEFRRYLRAKLPEHMVPSTYWRIEALPRLTSGKVNRGALSGSQVTPVREEVELKAPRNQTEAKLAAIWQEVLQVRQVGIEQNFFELGGHSLLVLQMMGRIRRALDVELPVRSAFESPTIAALALEVDKAEAAGLKARTPIFQQLPRAAVTETTREALLAELKKLSAEDARKFIESAVERKTPL